MASVSFEQLQQLLKNAGIDKLNNPVIVGSMVGGVTQNMAAIAIAESGDVNHPEKGANSQAHNPNPPDNSYGLWQINMIGNLGAQRRKEYNLPNNEALFDPATNARVAVGILRTQGPNAWSTFKNGKSKDALRNLKKGGAQVDANYSISEVGESATNTVTGGITGAVNTLSKSIFGIALNAGVFLAAALLLILGIILLMREPIAAVAKKTVIGRTASLAKKVA